MSTLIRSALVAVALFGTVSAVSAAPRFSADPYANSDTFNSGPIDSFDRLTHKAG